MDLVELLLSIATPLGAGLLGGVIAHVAATGEGRRNWNVQQIEKQRSFYIEVVGAAERLLVVSGRMREITEDEIRRVRSELTGPPAPGQQFILEVPADLKERVDVATEAWRVVHSKRLVLAGATIAEAMQAVDAARADVVRALNNVPRDGFAQTFDKQDVALQRLYRAVQLESARMNIVLANSLFPFWSRRKHRQPAEKHLRTLDREDDAVG